MYSLCRRECNLLAKTLDLSFSTLTPNTEQVSLKPVYGLRFTFEGGVLRVSLIEAI